MEAGSFYLIDADINKYEYWRKLAIEYNFINLDYEQHPEWNFWLGKLTLSPLSLIDGYAIEKSDWSGKIFLIL